MVSTDFADRDPCTRWTVYFALFILILLHSANIYIILLYWIEQHIYCPESVASFVLSTIVFITLILICTEFVRKRYDCIGDNGDERTVIYLTIIFFTLVSSFMIGLMSLSLGCQSMLVVYIIDLVYVGLFVAPLVLYLFGYCIYGVAQFCH